LFLSEFRSPLVIILVAAAVLLFVVSIVGTESDQIIDASLILGIVVLNACLGFFQNYRAQRGIEALRRLATPMATFIRDGRPTTGEGFILVPGDIVLLEEGGGVPADGRVIEAYDLQLDEAALTGESMPVEKSLGSLAPDVNLAERANMVFTGTTVLRGRGRFVVTETGMVTEMGRIARGIQTVKEGPTHFQQQVAEMGKRITAIIALLLAVIVTLQLTIGGFSLLETFVAAVALAVAAIPEGLPVVLTLALAFGTRRMLQRNALVRSLPVVEIVGSAQVICTDKTGTITEGRMSLRTLFWRDAYYEVSGAATDTEGEFLLDGVPTDQSLNPAMLAAGLCNNALYDGENGFSGDPTEVALLAAALKSKVALTDYARVDEIPFSSERKLMSVVVERNGKQTVFVKGAPEVVIERCVSTYSDDEASLDSDIDEEGLLQAASRMASEGLRVLALASKREGFGRRSEIENDLVFLGLAGLNDPPRPEAREALQTTRKAGIRVVMITGDNLLTATAIARDLGLESDCIEAREIDVLSDEHLVEFVRQVGVYARAEPRHKLRILNALKNLGQVVVMTGDGVNDAPALKGADVGIAMGIKGTDVAKDASDMVLLDDNFATIVAAVEEGRRIHANIKKFLNYLLVGNMAEVLVVLAASFGGYLPITAVQLLWINLVTDSGPAVALGMDPPPPGLMERPPEKGTIISRAMLALIFAAGAVMAIIIGISFFIGLRWYDLETARTIVFAALVAHQYLRVAIIHYQEKTPMLANKWLLLAMVLSLCLQLIIIYSPMNSVFGVTPLGAGAWGIILIGVVTGFFATRLVTMVVVRYFGRI